MKKNRFALCLMAGLISLSAVPMSVSATDVSRDTLLIAENPVSKKTDEPTTEALEAVIKIIKPRLSVPAECTDFRWDYTGGSPYSDASWSLTWSSPDGDKSVRVSCDEKGNLISYSLYDSARYDAPFAFPEKAKEEYTETAKNFLARLAPDAHFALSSASDASGISRPTYSYEFLRTENGLSDPFQSADVAIDALTGEVTRCDVTYNYDTVVRSVENPITAEKAKEILRGTLKMELSYTTNRTYNDDGTVEEKAVLVYRPSGTNLSIDAVTGEVYTTRSSWSPVGGGSGGTFSNDTAKADAAEAEGEYTLTEEELAGLSELSGLITKEEAIKKVTDNPALYLDIRLSVVEASLSRGFSHSRYYVPQNEGDDNFTWNVRFTMPERDADSSDYYDYVSASATVDAKTGRVLRFDSDLHDAWYYEKNGLDVPKKQYSESDCEKVLADFAKKNTDYFDLTRRSELYDENTIFVAYDENGTVTDRTYGAYGYRFVRVNEGLDYNADYICGTVDGITGKISRFSTAWTNDLVFESPRDAITEEKAFDLYFDLSDVELYYEDYTEYFYGTIEKSDGDKLKNLILRLKKSPNKAEEIVSELAPKLDKEKVNEYLAAADFDGLVSLCAEYYGVDPVSAVNFYYGTSDLYSRTVTARPVYSPKDPRTYIGALTGKKVTYNGSVIEEIPQGDFTDIDSHWAKDYIEKLSRVGILSRESTFRPDEKITSEDFSTMLSRAGLYYRYSRNEKTPETESVTRLTAVKEIIDAMNLSRAAKISGIYRTEFSDNPLIKEEDIGYLAIAYGLSIIDGDKGTLTFRPDDTVTRAEAAKLVYAAVLANSDQ